MRSNTQEHRDFVRSKFPDAFELFYAIFEGTVDEVQNRLAAGDNPNAISILGTTPIFYATQFSSKLDKAEVLFSAGAVINSWDNQGRHPLHHNSFCEPCSAWLLSHGADPNAAVLPAKEKQFDPIGWTALHMAVARGFLSTTELLLAYRADPNRQSQDGSTPLHVAVRQQKLYKRLIRTLIDAGADVNIINSVGDTPLHEVLSHSGQHSHAVIRLLLFRGARVDIRNTSGLFPSEMLPDTPFGNTLKPLFIRHLPKSD
ncbi:MAG: ankyrin repeat domain-containing protein [Chloroflexota bacterium]